MLMSFIAAFLAAAIRNRMHVLDIPYVAVPSAIAEKDPLLVIGEKEERVAIERQDPEPSVFCSDPSVLFFALNCLGADVFEEEKDGGIRIIPAVLVKDAGDCLSAFGIHCPEAVLIGQDRSLALVIENSLKNYCRKSRVFATRPVVTQEEIRKKLEEELKERTPGGQQEEKETGKVSGKPDGSAIPEKPKRHPGRPKGAKNRKTLEREAQQAQEGTPVSPKRKRGRPAGSKDSKPRKKSHDFPHKE
jgi:hypothetical protein